jgi:hypothetical protein
MRAVYGGNVLREAQWDNGYGGLISKKWGKKICVTKQQDEFQKLVRSFSKLEEVVGKNDYVQF